MSSLPKRIINMFLRSTRQNILRFVPGLRISRYPRLHSAVLRLLRRTSLPCLDNVLGHRMFLDRHDSLHLSLNGIYEPSETAFFQRVIQPNQVVADIGANIGYHTLLFARSVGPNGHVHAFEPNQECIALLRRNIAANRYANVTVCEKAVSDATGPLQLFLNEDNLGDHRTYDAGDRRNAIQVQAVSIDDYCATTGVRFDWIKMDIQGAEYRAVKGMSSILRANPHTAIVTEFWPAGLQSAGTEPASYLGLLASLGLRLSLLDENSEEFPVSDPCDLLRKCTTENIDHVNVICRPKAGDAGPL
jgi:FkbM family methyltransferase